MESEILETMQKVMECVHNLDQCASCPVDGKCLANFEELIEVGNLTSFPGSCTCPLKWIALAHSQTGMGLGG